MCRGLNMQSPSTWTHCFRCAVLGWLGSACSTLSRTGRQWRETAMGLGGTMTRSKSVVEYGKYSVDGDVFHKLEIVVFTVVSMFDNRDGDVFSPGLFLAQCGVSAKKIASYSRSIWGWLIALMTKVMTWEWFLALTWNKVNGHSEVVIFTQIIHYIMYVY